MQATLFMIFQHSYLCTGNNTFLPHSQMTPVASRNRQNSHTNQTNSRSGAGAQNTPNLLQQRKPRNGNPSSSSFHTWNANSGGSVQRHATPGGVQGGANIRPWGNQQSKLGMLPPTAAVPSIRPSRGRGHSGPQRSNSCPSNITSTNGGGALSSDGDRDIMCNCGQNAILLTVRKEGPNTGRVSFWKGALWLDSGIVIKQTCLGHRVWLISSSFILKFVIV